MELRNTLKDVTFKHSFMNNVDFAHAHTLTYTLTNTHIYLHFHTCMHTCTL